MKLGRATGGLEPVATSPLSPGCFQELGVTSVIALTIRVTMTICETVIACSCVQLAQAPVGFPSVLPHRSLDLSIASCYEFRIQHPSPDPRFIK